MAFILHPNLLEKDFIIDLALCRVLLEDNMHYPWIFLVPRIENVSRIMELNEKNQIQLMKEINITEKIMWHLFNPAQLNVATIGNKTPQLHVHVIARFEDDPSWPETVWGTGNKKSYTEIEKTKTIQKIKEALTHS